MICPNEATLTFLAYLITWPQMIFDLDMWPVTSSTNGGFHVTYRTQLWLKFINPCENYSQMLTCFHNNNRQQQWTKWSLCVFPRWLFRLFFAFKLLFSLFETSTSLPLRVQVGIKFEVLYFFCYENSWFSKSKSLSTKSCHIFIFSMQDNKISKGQAIFSDC